LNREMGLEGPLVGIPAVGEEEQVDESSVYLRHAPI